MSKQSEPLLWLNDARGIYIPQNFAESFADRSKSVSGVTDEQWGILEAGPGHEFYWDVWTEICDSAKVTDDSGVVFTVYQNGDCWLIPEGMEWDEESEFFTWPKEEEDETED